MSRFVSQRTLWAAVVLMAAASYAVAQQTAPPVEPRQPAQGGPAVQPRPPVGGQQNVTMQDRQLAQCMIIGNRGEVALARFAQQRAQTQEVKEFAEQMIEDHSQMIDRLQQFTMERRNPGRANEQPARQPREDEGKKSDREQRGYREQQQQQQQDPQAQTPPRQQPGQPIARPMQGGTEGLDFVEVKRQLGERWIATLKRELDEKQGTEFDRCYMAAMVMSHLHMLDQLDVFKNHASPQLQQVISDATNTAEQHLEHAKSIHKQLEGRMANRTGNGQQQPNRR